MSYDYDPEYTEYTHIYTPEILLEINRTLHLRKRKNCRNEIELC